MSGEARKPEAQPMLQPASRATATPAAHAPPPPPNVPGSVLQLQRTAGNRATSRLLHDVPPPAVTGASGEGRPLDAPLRDEMESRFGADFSEVRLHTGQHAAGSAQALSAKAYTVGRDIVFSEGRFAPHTGAGRHLLAHELSHVVQQSRRAASPPESHQLEKSAQGAAAQITRATGAVGVAGAASPGLARDPEDERKSASLTQRGFAFLSRQAPGVARAAARALPVAEAIEATLAPETKQQLGRALDHLETRSAEAARNLKQTTWVGTPPLEVRQQRALDQRKRDEGAKDGSPVGLGDPAPRPGAASAQDLPSGNLLASEPEPTPFEAQLRSGKTFTHTLPPAKPDIDPRAATWIGERPTDAAMKSMQMRAAGDLAPSTRIHMPGDARTDIPISGTDVSQVRDPKTGELKGYRIRTGETVWEVDRNGNTIDTRGLEAALEEPAVDPLDVLMLGMDLGPMIAKGITAGGKAAARKLARTAARGTVEGATEEATSLAAKKGSSKLGSGAADGAKITRPSVSYEGGELPLIVDDAVPADVVGRKPRGFETGRAKPGRNLTPGTMEDLETTALERARKPRSRNLTRADQLEGLDLAPGSGRADPQPFMNDALKRATDGDHPLHQLVKPGQQAEEFEWHTTTRVTKSGKVQTGRYQGGETDPIVQAGHKDAFAARGGKQKFMLEDADLNQVTGQTIESKGAYSYKQRLFVTKADGTAGIWVEKESLEQWERLGRVPSGTTSRASAHPATMADLPK